MLCLTAFSLRTLKWDCSLLSSETVDRSWIHSDCVRVFLWIENDTWAMWYENLRCDFSVFDICVRVMLGFLNCSRGWTILREIVDNCGQSGHNCNRIEVARHLKSPHAVAKTTSWTVVINLRFTVLLRRVENCFSNVVSKYGRCGRVEPNKPWHWVWNCGCGHFSVFFP